MTVVLGPVLAAVLAASSPVATTDSTYLSLGDSMTAASPGPTYPTMVAASLRARQPRLRVQSLGCAGITARQVIAGGGPCAYPQPSQLDAALAGLRDRAGAVDLVTVTVGANDVISCVAQASDACLRERLPGVIADVRLIARRVADAAGPNARLVGTTYHAPFLGYWVQGREQQARGSVDVVTTFNRAVADAYRAEGWQVADVAADWAVSDFSVAPGASVPRNVVTTCRWTRACPVDPAAFDVHPTVTGYERIARLVLRVRAAWSP